jgi:D-alanyl-D-alanine dipeptidase
MNTKSLFYLCGAAIAIIEPFYAASQQGHLQIVDNKRNYRRTIAHDNEAKLLELKTYIPAIQYELAYATKENFIHQKLYASGSKTYLRHPVVTALQQAQQELAQQGYGIIVWDAYRPYSVTKKMWKTVGDERYVAHPAKGSGHNRGTAIDLTLFRLDNGMQLDMGTGFDAFSDTAHHGFAGLSPEQEKNRQLLKTTMEKFGFKALNTEWWHYSWQGKTFDVLNLSFRQLAKMED